MLSLDDSQRIEEEERYRALVRRHLGPVETTCLINRLAKFAVKAFMWSVLAMIGLALLDSSTPKKQKAASVGGRSQSPAQMINECFLIQDAWRRADCLKHTSTGQSSQISLSELDALRQRLAQ